MDYPTLFTGRDERVPPKDNIGGACLSRPPKRIRSSNGIQRT